MSVLAPLRSSVVALVVMLIAVSRASGDALARFVAEHDPAYGWKFVERFEVEGLAAQRYEVVSQAWRGGRWAHQLLIVEPPKVRAEAPVFVYVTGSGAYDRELERLALVARTAGVVAAAVTEIPNQPLFGALKEDKLIAHTFVHFERTGDPSWPLLFPMVRGVVRTLDAIAEIRGAQQFVLSGASKRGWTTYLTSVVDSRVIAIAPKVFDMLNMRAQIKSAAERYGAQSEKLKPYTELGLVDRIDSPEIRALRGLVDPWSYRQRLTLPKFLLLGTNDRYFVVDGIRHYLGDLPGRTDVYQTPNAGHSLPRSADEMMAVWVASIAAGETLPSFNGELHLSGTPLIVTTISERPQSVRLWEACQAGLDFRTAVWREREVPLSPHLVFPTRVGLGVPVGSDAAPSAEWCAVMAEARFGRMAGELRLSTRVWLFDVGPTSRSPTSAEY